MKMKIIKLGRFDDVRVWRDDSPLVIKQTASNHPKKHDAPIDALSLEWYAPRGAHFLYGLLSATKARGPAPATVTIDIPPPSPISGFATPIDLLDRVELGLPPEFADSIARAAADACSTYLPEGVVVFHAAVSSRLGSSGLIFGRLAKAVVRIFGMDDALADEERLAAVLGTELLPRN
jgi:hypothetical protein